MKNVIVTGANQGIGFGIVSSFCSKLPKGSNVYLVGRNEQKVNEAVEQLKNDEVNVIGGIMDLSDKQSINEFINLLENEKLKFDYVVSNASPRMDNDISKADQVEDFINVSNINSLYFIKNILKLMNDNSKVIQVSSSFGKISSLDESLQAKILNVKSVDELEDLINCYIEDVKNGDDEDKLWPSWINIPSKVFQVQAMKKLISEVKNYTNNNLTLLSINPGLVQTLASKPFFDEEAFAKAQTISEAGDNITSFIMDVNNVNNGCLYDTYKKEILEK